MGNGILVPAFQFFSSVFIGKLIRLCMFFKIVSSARERYSSKKLIFIN